jgi:hypothetical protein
VHHQSEEYNLSVALRQSSLQGFISMIFYLPLALIGFNPISFVAINAFQTLYQFWIHTQTIDRLHPAIEYIFNTPSHHRVHHGRNPKYLDKNHGGTLIIFDRLFGTFQMEEEQVVYGVTKPLASWNPVWANFDYFTDLWKILRKPIGWADRFRLLIAEPGWMPESLGGYQMPKNVDPEHPISYDTIVPQPFNYYVFMQYLATLGLTTYFLFNLDSFSMMGQLIFSAWIILSIVNAGAIFERKTWGFYAEIFRLLSITSMILLIGSGLWGSILLILTSMSSMIWFLRLRVYFPIKAVT